MLLREVLEIVIEQQNTRKYSYKYLDYCLHFFSLNANKFHTAT